MQYRRTKIVDNSYIRQQIMNADPGLDETCFRTSSRCRTETVTLRIVKRHFDADDVGQRRERR